MYHHFTEDEIRAICRTHLESFEKWARLIAHKILSERLGDGYFFLTNPDGSNLVKKAIVDKAKEMLGREPQRFSGPMDTLFLEEIIYIFCKSEFYKDYFSTFLSKMYPAGPEELRTFLSRLIPIRNKLSHSNSFSIRDAEQCVCYCNDFIDCVKDYFVMTNQQKEFNVPTIIKVTDSLGNVYILKEGRAGENLDIVDPVTKQRKVFFLSDTFSLELTIDPSFEDSSYSLQWTPRSGLQVVNSGRKINVLITNELIGEEVVIWCRLVTTNEWHRYLNYDQQLMVHFKALVPS